MQSRVVVPSIPYLNYVLFEILSKHPLLTQSLINHPASNKPIKISSFRFMDGFPLGAQDNSVICAIYPSFAKDSPVSPGSTATSVLYKPYDLGLEGYEEVIYHFIVKFYYQEVVLPGTFKEESKELITIQNNQLINPNQNLLLSKSTSEVELFLNPGLNIVGEYLELSRLALLDLDSFAGLPIGIKSLEVIHQNYPSPKWDGDSNIFVHNGSLLLRVTTFSSRGWRDKFINPVENFNLIINEIESQNLPSIQPTEQVVGSSINSSSFVGIDEKNKPNGVAGLNSQGVLDPALIPTQFIEESELQQQLNAIPGASVFQLNFSDSNLSVAGALPINHNFNKLPISLKVRDGNGNLVIPDNHVDNLNNSIIYLDSFRPLEGSWSLMLTA